MVTLALEVAAVLFLAIFWMFAIAQMIEKRRWSPLRPAVMLIVITGCLAMMGQTLGDYAVTGELRSTFYLAAWNLGMALFDCKIALVLARRGRLKPGPVLATATDSQPVGARDAGRATPGAPADPAAQANAEAGAGAQAA
ncbi:MAG: hypothetical protein AAF677_02965 [Pseudomonadota bacterium]